MGAKTIEIIHNIIDIGTPLEDLMVDTDVIDSVINNVKKAKKKAVETEKTLRLRLGEHKEEPQYKHFTEKPNELRLRIEENLITSIDSLQELLATVRELLEEEKHENQPEDKQAKAQAALTELFKSIRPQPHHYQTSDLRYR